MPASVGQCSFRYLPSERSSEGRHANVSSRANVPYVCSRANVSKCADLAHLPTWALFCTFAGVQTLAMPASLASLRDFQPQGRHASMLASMRARLAWVLGMRACKARPRLGPEGALTCACLAYMRALHVCKHGLHACGACMYACLHGMQACVC